MLENEQAYLYLLKKILLYGEKHNDRTGTGTTRLFGEKLSFDLRGQFPLLTTKYVPFKLVASELLWFIKGGRDLNINKLKAIHPNTIWDEWARKDGGLGPVYGAQWRSWEHKGVYIDQLVQAINTIKNNPDSRRIIVSAWNPGEIHKMALPPCHLLFQFSVGEDGLSCILYQRSCDMFLGVPFNIASYSLLTCMIADLCGLEPNRFVWFGADVHIYNNHIDQVEEQLSRSVYKAPTLNIRPGALHIEDYCMDDFEVLNYKHHPSIKAEVSV